MSSSFSLPSNLPQFYADCPSFPADFPELSGPPAAAAAGGAMWGEEGGFSLMDYGQVPPEVDVGAAVSGLVFPDRAGVSDMAVPALPEFNMGGLCGIAGVQGFGGGYQQDACEFGEECGGFVPDFRPVYPAAAGDNWGIQGSHMTGIEESNTKVGRYSVEERKDRILRYLKKRNQRNFNKTIKYACRKTLADRRVRVRGRFARNSELCEEEVAVKKNENIQEEKELYYNDHSVQMKHDEEDWLQEAIASLMYLPYFSG